MELLQSCTKPSIWNIQFWEHDAKHKCFTRNETNGWCYQHFSFAMIGLSLKIQLSDTMFVMLHHWNCAVDIYRWLFVYTWAVLISTKWIPSIYIHIYDIFFRIWAYTVLCVHCIGISVYHIPECYVSLIFRYSNQRWKVSNMCYQWVIIDTIYHISRSSTI